MRKIYFLVIVFLSVFINQNLFSNILVEENISELSADNFDDEINIDNTKYLKLSYKNGKFYSWNQELTKEHHMLGIFVDENYQSYLLDNFGVFWTSQYQISNFTRVNNKLGIAQIKYLKDNNGVEYFNKNFFVEIKDNELILVQDNPINTENRDFVVLNENYVVSYGLGLDLIEIATQQVKTINNPYDKTNYEITFYRINDNQGIIAASNQYFYLLKNITSANVSETKIDIKASKNITNNVVVINDKNIVIRGEDDYLFFLNLEPNITINEWKIKSYASNIAFVLNQDTFILNISSSNLSNYFGKPYLIKTKEWNKKINIDNIETMNNFIIIDNNKGILIDKFFFAKRFEFDPDNNKFLLSDVGNVDSLQFINSNLLFGNFKNDNFLFSEESYQDWAFANKVEFFTSNSSTKINFLNNVLNLKNKIEYKNTYFSNGPATISITDNNLIEMKIISAVKEETLKPNDNKIEYQFLRYDKYKIIIKFKINDQEYNLNYNVVLNKFDNYLLDISAKQIHSYVGYYKDKLYDIKITNEKNKLAIGHYNYENLQNVQLNCYSNDNMVLNSVSNLINDLEIEFDNVNPDYFYGLKMINLLNQVSWVYLGFSQNGVKPMIDFWDTDIGKNLMQEAFLHNYSKQDLKNMDSQQIIELMQVASNWNAIKIQSKTLIVFIMTMLIFSLIITFMGLIYNMILNIKIKKNNKIL